MEKEHRTVLSDLIVHNFAIIRNLEVSFQPGLNVLSGETGAGKSILVGAVNLILGSRASQEMIRTGTTEATVEAVFPLAGQHSVLKRMAEWGLDAGGELCIRRSINRSGRNRVYINDQAISLQQLQQLVAGIISISGQHEHQLLLDPELHLDFLDAFGCLEGPCKEVSDVHADWSKTHEKLREVRRFKQERASKLEWMRFQLQELESADLKEDEDNLLERELHLLRHAATLSEAAQGAHRTLYAGRGAILEQLADVEKNIQTLRQIDPNQQDLVDHLEEARIHLEELAHSVQQYAGRIVFDPQRLAAVEERLAAIQRLGKKHGGSVEAMLLRRDELRRMLSADEDADLREEELVKALARIRQIYVEKAEALSRLRRKAAERLSGEVEKTLASLDMPKARFSVGFDSPEEGKDASESRFTPRGIDRVEFLLSANPGEDLKPLARIASGGELSRILLALKSLLSRKGEAETLIFDEVDTGIGGRTAELVGLQLKRLAEKHQVICITHLPQIACHGKTHYKVAKNAGDGGTVTTIRPIASEDRVEELARMLGGISISEKVRAHARELLQQTQNAER
ncbi:MAG: DNA repair protein RecN [Syntrophobacteraceae bacterium]